MINNKYNLKINQILRTREKTDLELRKRKAQDLALALDLSSLLAVLLDVGGGAGKIEPELNRGLLQLRELVLNELPGSNEHLGRETASETNGGSTKVNSARGAPRGPIGTLSNK